MRVPRNLILSFVSFAVSFIIVSLSYKDTVRATLMAFGVGILFGGSLASYFFGVATITTKRFQEVMISGLNSRVKGIKNKREMDISDVIMYMGDPESIIRTASEAEKERASWTLNKEKPTKPS